MLEGDPQAPPTHHDHDEDGKDSTGEIACHYMRGRKVWGEGGRGEGGRGEGGRGEGGREEGGRGEGGRGREACHKMSGREGEGD